VSAPAAPEPPLESRVQSGWPLRDRLGPLALPPRRVRLWAVALAIAGLIPIETAFVSGGGDWSVFWSAGATVGTADFLDAGRHFAWQSAHGVIEYFFPYPPAAAWPLWPLGHMPIWLGFAFNAALMLGCVLAAGLFVARIFGMRRDVAILLAFAWTPLTASADFGQNATFAALLALWAIDGLRRDRPLEVGVAVGLMMYKPTLALPLLGLLVLRWRWRDLLVAAAVVGGGYLASVAAAAGNWQWPGTWWTQLQPWLARDLAGNADKAVSIPGLIGRLPGVPAWLPIAVMVAIVLLALPGLIRAPLVEAAAGACLLALAAGPRVWGYEAGLLLPMLAWAASGGVDEPWRTRLLVVAVPMGLLWVFSLYTIVSGVAVVVALAMALWIVRWWPGTDARGVRSAARLRPSGFRVPLE